MRSPESIAAASRGGQGAAAHEAVDVDAVALVGGHAAALVWGWSRYPFLSRSAMMLRRVAEESVRPERARRLSEPTGSPVAMWSWMRDLQDFPAALVEGRIRHRAIGPNFRRPW